MSWWSRRTWYCLVWMMVAGGSGSLLQATGMVQVDEDIEVDWPKKNPETEEFTLTARIQRRFAVTHVTSVIRNKENEAREAVFSVRTPKTAFITDFAMTLNNKIYNGEVKEKRLAKKEFDKEKFRSFKTHAHRAEKLNDSPRSSNVFRVTVTLSARTSATFNLTYEELLTRQLSKYDYVIDLDPGQVIRTLRMNVHISESRDIIGLEVPPLKKTTVSQTEIKTVNPLAKTRRINSKNIQISIEPTPRQQLQESPQGIAGQFRIRYDVTRSANHAGEFQVGKGQFIQFFAPKYPSTVKKDIIFILDVSGSMSGSKLIHTKNAMYKIVDALNPGDRFNIMTFSNYLRFWNRNAIQEVTEKNKKKAKTFITEMLADGGTNFNDAILRGIDFMKRQIVSIADLPRAFIIVFLTDGEPTAGITQKEQILANVRKNNQGKCTIFGLGYGKSADFHFLQKISIQNGGHASRIYEDFDAQFQLERFYATISNPLLSEVNFAYPHQMIDRYGVTKSEITNYYRGSEIVSAGTFNPLLREKLTIRVTAESTQGNVSFSSLLIPRDSLPASETNITRRMWAFQTIKDLLNKILETTNQTQRAVYEKEALDLSLQYSYVNRLTSMVVVKPGEPKKNVGTFRNPEDVFKDRKSARDKSISGFSRPSHDSEPPFVDNDPHFIVSFNGSKEAVCFDITGKIGDVYQLLYDKKSGIVVNGYVVGKKPEEGKHMRTYFGKISIMTIDREVSVTVMPSKIKVNDKALTWRNSTTYTVSGVSVNVAARKNVTVSFFNDVTFVVARHKVRKHHPVKVDYLGFYISNGNGLSKKVHGLIGQFHHQKLNVSLLEDKGRIKGTLAKLKLTGPNSNEHSFKARYSHRRNMLTHARVPCWQVGNNGRGLIAGTHADYLVPTITYNGFSFSFAQLLPFFL